MSKTKGKVNKEEETGVGVVLCVLLLLLVVSVFASYQFGYENGQQSVIKFERCITGHELDNSVIQICRDTYL